MYAQIRNHDRPEAGRQAITETPQIATDDDELLERLVMLEQRLAQDLARKPKHQKPQLQQQWQEEIAQINQQLG